MIRQIEFDHNILLILNVNPNPLKHEIISTENDTTQYRIKNNLYLICIEKCRNWLSLNVKHMSYMFKLNWYQLKLMNISNILIGQPNLYPYRNRILGRYMKIWSYWPRHLQAIVFCIITFLITKQTSCRFCLFPSSCCGFYLAVILANKTIFLILLNNLFL